MITNKIHVTGKGIVLIDPDLYATDMSIGEEIEYEGIKYIVTGVEAAVYLLFSTPMKKGIGIIVKQISDV